MAIAHDCSSVFFDVTARVGACVDWWIIVVIVKGVTTVQVMPVTKIDGDRIKRLVDLAKVNGMSPSIKPLVMQPEVILTLVHA